MTFTKRQEEAVRAIVGLPEDDWQPMDWATFSVARDVLAEELGRVDRAAKSRTEARQAVGLAPKRPRQAREPHALTKAKRVVKDRSGGMCEANTPACLDGPHQAHHVHHVAGRTDHRPVSLLHVCHVAHTFIHANPELSRERGWMVLRLGSDDIRSTKPSRG